jgi:hypothetical protein
VTRVIKRADYHNLPIVIIEMGVEENWQVRQPQERDFYAISDVIAEHSKRCLEHAGISHKPYQTDPVELTSRYLEASIVSIFLTPPQTPERILEELGPGMLHEINLEIQQVLNGEAAKKAIARS